ncbi:MAG: hypothetical protein LBB41_07370 [Prevotellaceae bacterium]|jgi:hypothetical protein|nr:hypothetical protein [Prevotellaceae bacterium]
MEDIQLWKAIEQMRDISRAGKTFSIGFYKYDRQSRKGGDFARLARVRLRSKASDDKIANASHKLFFVDTETGRNRVCWQILIKEFNGGKIIL